MKIKSTRQFRNLYKNEIREIDSTNRNENFVGVRTEINGKSQYGFFEIYHGDKEGFNSSDGIRGFLEGFLDMAKDGQAVYEFMQNAVDAGSTKFCLFWGKDEVDGNTYLMVANNGAMFNMDSIRSILNVGVSTKSTNNFTIGKFGIGFKLAHRLVGKENGLDELIHQNYGPILFSWKNNEINRLGDFVEKPVVTPCEQKYEVFSEGGKRKAHLLTDDPWLFKILITNFPCQPENAIEPELIYDSQYNSSSNAFSKSELKALGRWVQNRSAYFRNDFNEGALFFIRLGQGKHSHLEEENLEEGVKFSLAILNKIAKKSLSIDGLKTVNLKGNELEPVDLNFESFIISKTENRKEYRFLRFGKDEDLSDVELSKESADSDVEILLGFIDYKNAKEAFHNAPNFYLFFPLSEEKHRLRFIIHSNAFYKSSSRTYLQKGSVGEEGINERLFRVFVDRLNERMLSWVESGEKNLRDRFLQLYANLLLSNESDNPERVWVNEPLWKPILNFIESYIPVKEIKDNTFYLVDDQSSVRIKDTALPVDSESWMNGSVEWFFWDSSESEICYEAASKLNLERFGIVDLLQEDEIAGKLNSWLDRIHYEQVPTILAELNKSTVTNLEYPEIFWANFGQLKIWEFEDGFFSIEEIGDVAQYSNRLIMFDMLDLIKGQLTKCGWNLSKSSLADYPTLFPSIQNRFQHVVKYIRRYEELIRVLNLRLPDGNLTRSEKLNVISVLAKKLSDGKEDRINRIKELKIFRNRIGMNLPLKAIIKSTHVSWLGGWTIHSLDYDATLDDYLISNSKDIYANIIAIYWEEFVSQLTEIKDHVSLFDYAVGVYKHNNGLANLTDKSIVRVDNDFIDQTGSFYYSKCLAAFSEAEYQVLTSALKKLVEVSIPEYKLLKYYEEQPFKISPKELELTIEDTITVTTEEAIAFLKLLTKIESGLCNDFNISSVGDGDVAFSAKQNGIHMVVAKDELILGYIKKYHHLNLQVLPLCLYDFGDHFFLKDFNLLKRLVVEKNPLDDDQLSELMEIVLQSGSEAKKYLIDRIEEICFDLNKPLHPKDTSTLFVRLLHSLDDEIYANENIKDKAIIEFGDDSIHLADIQISGEDEVFFEDGEKKFQLSLSAILPSKDSHAAKIVGQLTEKLSDLGIAEKSVLDKSFGLTGHVDKAYIAEEVKEIYSGQILANAHQLAFVLHFSSRHPKLLPIHSYKVETNSGIFQLMNFVGYMPENLLKFIPERLVLHPKYNGLSKLLIQDDFGYDDISGIMICKGPYFDGNRLILPGITKISPIENQVLFVDFVFQKWRNNKNQIGNILLGSKEHWADLLGFEPTLTIAEGELIVESEKLPEVLQNWLSKPDVDKEKQEFLRALGVSLTGSDIIRIRKYLVGEDTNKPGINYNLPEELVLNTFELLEDRQVLFEIGSDQADLIADLYQRLPEITEYHQIPLPVIDDSSRNTLIIRSVSDAFTVESDVIGHLEQLGYESYRLPLDAGKPIIYSSLLKDLTKVRDIFDVVPLVFDELDVDAIGLNGIEWKRVFYQQWLAICPSHRIICYPGKLPFKITISGRSIHNYNEQEITLFSNQIIVNNDKNDKSIISEIEACNYLPEREIQLLREFYEKYDDSIQDFLSRIQSSPKLAEEFEKLKEKEKVEQKKKELTEEFGSSQKYSMAWFLNLLDLMVMSGGGKDLSNARGALVFNEIKYNPADLRIITLKNPSKAISPSIDLFADFKATFHYVDENNTQRSKQIKISGLSKKGHDVIAIPGNPEDLDQVNLSGVREVELTFVRHLDLINKLTKAFKELDFEDDFNLHDELTENIQFIFGPPGTGKTTEISKQVIQKMNQGATSKILILTPTNKAADVLVKKILDLSDDETFPDGWLVRFGTSSDIELLDRGIVYDGNSLEFDLYDKCVLVTTIQRFPYEKVMTRTDYAGEVRTRISEISWDSIIFDEASMIMLPAIVYPLYKRKYKESDEEDLTEFIIGGDPLQIPPIYDISDTDLGQENEDVKEENIYSMIGLKSFDPRVQATIPKFGNKITNLPVQFRSVEAIGTIFSKFQYEGILSHGRNEGEGGLPTPRPLPDFLNQLGFRPITIIRYPVNNTDTIYNPQKLTGSPYHIYSAFLLSELIKRFRKEVHDNWDIGVVTPYRSQATLLNKLVESHKDKSKLNIITDTVHGFQGGESDLVCAVFNPSSIDSSYSRFLKKEFIINVAISRARDYLFIFIPDQDNYGFTNLRLFHQRFHNSLLDIIQQLPSDSVADLDAGQIEKAIMGSVDYFQQNSFTNLHQDVNIYSDLFKNYIVKVNGSAIDIHIKPE